MRKKKKWDWHVRLVEYGNRAVPVFCFVSIIYLLPLGSGLFYNTNASTEDLIININCTPFQYLVLIAVQNILIYI